MTRRLVCVFLCVFFQCYLLLKAYAHPDSPFVAGFERFGRHGEIDKQTAGRLLVRELSCAACHASEDSLLAPKAGPNLVDASVRMNLPWVESFIADPHSIKPATTMPDVLGNHSLDERAAIAKSLTAFLSTQDQPLPDIKGSGLVPVPNEFWNKGDAANGKLLYHRVGCVACHEADKELAGKSTSTIDQLIEDLDAEEIAKLGLSAAARSMPSVPLSDLRAKYTVAGLTHFLFDPTHFRPAGRMPALKLSPVEAADIASYLLENQAPTQELIVDESEIDRGRRLFNELNCVQCHSAGDLKPKRAAMPFKELNLSSDKQCMNGTTSIRNRMDAEQVDSIRNALSPSRQTEKLETKVQLELQLLAFNCYACHEREGRGGVARFRRDHFETVSNIDLGDEGRLPPPLTGVGRKLQAAWLKNVLLGKKTDVRPHLQIRMPVFHSELANQLPEMFRKVDSAVGTQFTLSPKAEQIEIGRNLMDVGCVQCHSFGGNALPGVVGVDLRNVSSRLQPNWFQEFLLNPSSVKTRTRMPSFFPDGKSQRPDLLDGDVDRQIAAMWTYLNSKEPFELPDKIRDARARNYELKPTDKPIVLRTFMKDAGTHAVAVGFPQQTHYAFDAERVRLAIGWRGKFLDAQGTWFIRFAPPAEPLGNAIVHFADASPIAKLSDANEPWPNNEDGYRFSGYQLDTHGVPTILYRYDDVEIEDRLAPIDANTLKRTIKFRKAAAGTARFWFLAAEDTKLTRISDHAYVNRAGLKTTLVDHSGTLRIAKHFAGGDREEWLVPIEFEKSFNLEMYYQW